MGPDSLRYPIKCPEIPNDGQTKWRPHNLGTWLSLLPFLAVVAAAAVSGAVFMPGEWYASLTNPAGRHRTGYFRPHGPSFMS